MVLNRDNVFEISCFICVYRYVKNEMTFNSDSCAFLHRILLFFISITVKSFNVNFNNVILFYATSFKRKVKFRRRFN